MVGDTGTPSFPPKLAFVSVKKKQKMLGDAGTASFPPNWCWSLTRSEELKSSPNTPPEQPPGHATPPGEPPRSVPEMEIDPLPNGAPAAAATAVAAAAAAAANAPSSRLSQLTESLKLEHQFMRVPFEHYKKSIRANHRAVEKEVSAVISAVSDAAEASGEGDAVDRLSSLVSRLQGLKRKVL